MGNAIMEMLVAASMATLSPDQGLGTDDQATVAAMDLEYQAAVKRNDAKTMDRILHPEFAMIKGDGQLVTRADVIEGAQSGAYHYEKQDEIDGTQSVRVWGDTAVVTALLWVKGTNRGKPFDRRIWFSDTYVRTPDGWRYAFAQVSLPLPSE